MKMAEKLKKMGGGYKLQHLQPPDPNLLLTSWAIQLP